MCWNYLILFYYLLTGIWCSKSLIWYGQCKILASLNLYFFQNKEMQVATNTGPFVTSDLGFDCFRTSCFAFFLSGWTQRWTIKQIKHVRGSRNRFFSVLFILVTLIRTESFFDLRQIIWSLSRMCLARIYMEYYQRRKERRMECGWIKSDRFAQT